MTEPAAVEVRHGDDVLPSRLATSDLAVDAVVAAAGAALRLLRERSGREGTAVVDGRRVSAAFRSDKHLRINGEGVDGFAPLSRFWRTRGGWVRTHANYPHHRHRLLAALDLPDSTTPEQFAAAVAGLDALDVEDALVIADAVAVAVRTPEEWSKHPQAMALVSCPSLQ